MGAARQLNKLAGRLTFYIHYVESRYPIRNGVMTMQTEVENPKPSWQEKFCPHLPCVPVQRPPQGLISSANQQTVTLSPTPCMGPACAIFDTCQGEYSPRGIESRLVALLKEYGPILQKVGETLQKAAKNPLISRFMA